MLLPTRAKVHAFLYDIPMGANYLLPSGNANTAAANAVRDCGAVPGFVVLSSVIGTVVWAQGC